MISFPTEQTHSSEMYKLAMGKGISFGIGTFYVTNIFNIYWLAFRNHERERDM